MKLIRTPKEYSEFVQEAVAGNKHSWTHGDKDNVEQNIKWAYMNWGKPKSYPCVVVARTVYADPDSVWGPDHRIDIYYKKEMLRILKASQKDVDKYKKLIDKLTAGVA